MGYKTAQSSRTPTPTIKEKGKHQPQRNTTTTTTLAATFPTFLTLHTSFSSFILLTKNVELIKSYNVMGSFWENDDVWVLDFSLLEICLHNCDSSCHSPLSYGFGF